MVRHKKKAVNNKIVRCLVTGKILNGKEAISISNAETYIEKQGYKIIKDEQKVLGLINNG